MLLGLPAATAHASTQPGGQAPGVTTQASHATCDWTPAHDTGATDPGDPLSPNGDGNVPYAGWAGGAGNPGLAGSTGIAPSAVGSWHPVYTASLTTQSVAGGIVSRLGQQQSAGSHDGTGSSPCDWAPMYHVGEGHFVTALSTIEYGRIVYAAWGDRDGDPDRDVIHGNPDRDLGCGCNREPGYGIATNYGGHWHQVSTRGLPTQFITGITVDPFHAAHAYAVYNEDSSRFVHGTSPCRCGRGDGHVFETWDAGQTWTNISGNLPQLVSDVLVLLENGTLALATDAGVFTAFESRGAHTCWAHLGSGLPHVAVDDLTVGPDNYIYAATHGYGTWRFRL
jgi:hypothetical protein